MAEQTAPERLRDARGFTPLWIGQTVSQFGEQFANIAMPVLAVSLLHASEAEVGFLNAAATAAFLVVGLPAGAWIDRMRKRRVMIAADLVRVVTLLVIPLLWFTGGLEVWHLYLVAAALGIGNVFFGVSYQSFVPLVVPGTLVAPANGRLEASAQISRVAGPAAAGGLLGILAAPVVFATTAVGYAVSAVFLAFVKVDEVPPPKTERLPLWREIGEGLGYVVRHPLISRITATTAVSNLFSTIAMTLMPVLLLRELGVEPAVLGVLYGLGAIGGIVGAALASRVGALIGEGTSVPVSGILMGLALLLVPVALLLPTPAAIVLIGVAEFVIAFSVLVYNVLQVSFRQRVCPPRLLGRMNASIRFAVWGVMPIGALVAAWLGTAIGSVGAIIVGGVGTTLAALPTILSPLWGMRTLPEA